jgi:hypothetical protein
MARHLHGRSAHLKIRFRIAARRIAALAMLCAALPAATASAAVVETDACDDAVLSQPFKHWGDFAEYKLAPGGDLETGVEGWTLRGGAQVVDGSSTHAATGEVGTKSLALPAGASVTTPATCVNAAYPTIRFFARSSGGLVGRIPLMKVELVYRDNILGIVAIPVGIVVPSSSWQPTLQMLTASAVAGAVDNGEADLSLRFTSLAGTWKVDDIFVDPMRRG